MLDSIGQQLSTPAADNAGSSLLKAVFDIKLEALRIQSSSALLPIVLHSTLADSMVLYTERVSWAAAAATQLMREGLRESPFAAFKISLLMLQYLIEAVYSGLFYAVESDGSAIALLLRQVCFPSLYCIITSIALATIHPLAIQLYLNECCPIVIRKAIHV